MKNDEALLDADARRRAAMIAGDVQALGELLDDDLVWTHSSGRTDDKAAFLSGIASGTVSYHALDVDDVTLLQRGDVFILHGTLHGRASRDGQEKALTNRFLSVWLRDGARFKMVAWQSTGV
ncbi:MAG: nuclear transport factor 2 family protein [Pseudomonadales bacterium]|jgi:ketosteroid isomerase-like protein